MFVKLFKSVVFSYVLRKGLKDSEFFIGHKGDRDYTFCICSECGQNHPANLSRIDQFDPICPTCASKLSTSQKNNSYQTHCDLSVLEDLDYVS